MQGGAIQANVQLWDIRQFETKVHENRCYRFEAYGCKKTDRWQRTLENDITLLFGKYTHATEIADTGFPKHYFKFAAYNQIGQRADARDSILTGTLRHHYKALLIHQLTLTTSWQTTSAFYETCIQFVSPETRRATEYLAVMWTSKT